MKSMAMLRSGLVLGSIVFLAGCDRKTAPLTCEESASIQPRDSADGKPGTNGLDSVAFQTVSTELLAATTVALAEEMDGPPVPGEVYALSQAVKDAFLNDVPVGEYPSGKEIRQEVFAHAMQCALQEGVIVDDGDRKYPGKGLLTTTGDWFQKGLTTEAAEDLFACLAVLLNPHYSGVPVYLSGPSVEISDVLSYPHVEALWTVDIRSTGRPIYHVWPILDVLEITDCWDQDATDEDPWKYRVCGSNQEVCLPDVRVGLWQKECEQVEYSAGGQVKKDDSHVDCSAPPKQGEPAVKQHAIRSSLKTLCDAPSLFCPIAN